MLTNYERDEEMLDEVIEAVFAGNLTKAEETLNFMQGAGMRSEQIRRAKRRAGREQFTPPPLCVPIPLPQFGVDPHVVFGGPNGFHSTPKRRRA